MEVVIQPTVEQAVELAARLIAGRVRAKPDLVLGLATGRTMEGVYDRLVSIQQSDGLDFSRCRTFNLDEYIGIPGEDEHSYRYYMNHHLFSRVNIDRANTHIPDGMAADLQAEAARYEHLIDEAGGIDLQLLGIGEGGHIGFNEPLSALMSRTREKALTPVTRQQNAAMFGGDPDKVPKRAMTMGVGTIRKCFAGGDRSSGRDRRRRDPGSNGQWRICGDRPSGGEAGGQRRARSWTVPWADGGDER